MPNFTRACECSVPCERVMYNPQLSYAHLSILNLNNIWRGEVGRREAVQERYITAREVRQRTDTVLAKTDSDR